MKEAEKLALLRQLTRLRADRASIRLAKVQGLIDTLEERAAKLRDVPDAPFESLSASIVQDRWERWRATNLAQINTQIARLNVAAQPQRETRAREMAREAVLKKLERRL